VLERPPFGFGRRTAWRRRPELGRRQGPEPGAVRLRLRPPAVPGPRRPRRRATRTSCGRAAFSSPTSLLQRRAVNWELARTWPGTRSSPRAIACSQRAGRGDRRRPLADCGSTTSHVPVRIRKIEAWSKSEWLELPSLSGPRYATRLRQGGRGDGLDMAPRTLQLDDDVGRPIVDPSHRSPPWRQSVA